MANTITGALATLGLSDGEKALLARRLVEAGSTFVTVSGAWGYFDHHGDEVKWGGIKKGLTPLLPSVDRTLHAIVTDLEDRGLLDSTLILMMGEFGRSPTINKNAGRDHWPRVMSMVVAGGGMKHGQVIGSTDRQGGDIDSRRAKLRDSRIALDQSELDAMLTRVRVQHDAMTAYVDWIAAGEALAVYRGLLELAEARNRERLIAHIVRAVRDEMEAAAMQAKDAAKAEIMPRWRSLSRSRWRRKSRLPCPSRLLSRPWLLHRLH